MSFLVNDRYLAKRGCSGASAYHGRTSDHKGRYNAKVGTDGILQCIITAHSNTMFFHQPFIARMSDIASFSSITVSGHSIFFNDQNRVRTQNKDSNQNRNRTRTYHKLENVPVHQEPDNPSLFQTPRSRCPNHGRQPQTNHHHLSSQLLLKSPAAGGLECQSGRLRA